MSLKIAVGSDDQLRFLAHLVYQVSAAKNKISRFWIEVFSFGFASW